MIFLDKKSRLCKYRKLLLFEFQIIPLKNFLVNGLFKVKN